MKKNFILFPVLALLMAGCSLPRKVAVDNSALNQSVPLSQEQTNDLNAQVQDLTKQNGEPLIENEAIGANSINQNSSSSVVLNQAYADWQIYNNERYNYAIKYPSDWYIDTTYSETNFTQRGPKENNEFIGGDTNFSNYKNSSSYNMSNPAPKDLYSINLMIYKVDINMSYDQFISSTHFAYDTKDNININGISSIKLSWVSTDHPVGTTVVNTLVKVENKMFVFNYGGSHVSQQEKDIADKIINSFLINTNSQIYHNEKYGYEVKYPTDWGIFGSATSSSVAFGKTNQDPNNDGELFIRIDTERSAAQVVSDQELIEKGREGQSVIKKLPVVIDGLAGTLLVITNNELKKSIPTWEYNIVVVDKNKTTYILSNGAIKSNNFEEFYKNFRFR